MTTPLYSVWDKIKKEFDLDEELEEIDKDFDKFNDAYDKKSKT